MYSCLYLLIHFIDDVGSLVCMLHVEERERTNNNNNNNDNVMFCLIYIFFSLQSNAEMNLSPL